MRLVGRVEVHLPVDVLERAPTLWERLKQLWGEVDLRTERARARMTAATFLYEFRRVMDTLGIDNGRSLLVDGVTVFHDAVGKPGDLPDVLLALTEHVSVFGEAANEVRLSVECEEAGLAIGLDATVTPEHGRGEASARLALLGRPVDLVPRPGEEAAEYRARAQRFFASSPEARAVSLQFRNFVSRLEMELSRAFPDAEVKSAVETLDMAGITDDLFDLPPPASANAPVSSPPAVDTAAPQRNFSLSVEQRISALMGGPPQYSVRLRKIEDLEAELVQAMASRHGQETVALAVVKAIEEYNRLVDVHNRYYPMEANLPIDVETGALMEAGRPWKPRPRMTIDALRARARR